MSRKSTSFAQLYDYMNASQTMGDGFAWNIHGMTRSQHLSHFYNNASLLRSHAKGNVLYHEIISLKYCDTASLQRQQKALYDLTHKYLSSRGRELLGYGRIHIEKGHIHMHLMLSANELNQSKRHRLSKSDFREIQKQCELYIQQTYPDLEQQSVYTKAYQKAEKTAEKAPTSAFPAEATKQTRTSRRKELDDLYEYYQRINNVLDAPKR